MSQDNSVIEVAYTDSSSDFDKILPLRPTLLDVVPIRFELQTGRKSIKIIELSNNSEYAQHIYKTILAALASDWFANQADISKQNISKVLFHFIEWLNTCDISQDNRYKLLKSYESKRTSEDSVKPQSSGLHKIIPMLNEGIYIESLNQKTAAYISELLKNTTISVHDETNTLTLSTFFSSMPWLREVIGEEDYLKLESPKCLVDSFSITISTTLLFIIETKKQARLRLKKTSELQTNNAKSKQQLRQSYSLKLLTKLGSLDKDGQPADDLTRMIIADCVSLDRHDRLLLSWASIMPGKNFNQKTFNDFISPHILAAKYWDTPSPIEQLLFSWLCACQMVQPSDIGKLKRKDFVVERNIYGRPVAIQCSYYKGRSGCKHEPPVLDASSIESMAMLAYLDYAESASSTLSNAPCSVEMCSRPSTILIRLLRLWSDKTLSSLIHDKVTQRRCSHLFLRAYTSMLMASSITYRSWRVKNTGRMDRYKQNVARPLPYSLFGLVAIKTSAVHAKSDKYRESDLVNQNSHSNQTEKMHYLTDANKDWVNQNGRVIRTVLLDIERYVYRPNLDAAIQQAHEDLLRTRVIGALDTGIDSKNKVRINSLGRTDLGKDEIGNAGIDADSIVVLDTPETVINMLHYINETDRQKDTLISNALPFFERTVLPTVEWMHIVMIRMSPISVQEGERSYKEIQDFLPPLFSNELYAGITS